MNYPTLYDKTGDIKDLNTILVPLRELRTLIANASKGPCACLGPQGKDSECPCVMEQKGLSPDWQKSTESFKALNETLDEIFGDKKK